MEKYVSKAIPVEITASSRVSVKIKETYYTFEYSEKRSIENYDRVDMDQEREDLWNTCHGEVDKQVKELLDG